MKNIKFKFSLLQGVGLPSDLYGKPEPANKHIPEWYRNIPSKLDNDKKFGIARYVTSGTNSTIKGCSPFLDAMTAGYVYTLPTDVEFRIIEDGNITVKWSTGGEFVSDHSANQHPGLPPAHKDFDFVLKWAFPFVIETPPGYSCIYTHPINQHNLPFRTFTGIVETDKYPLPVQFPFQIVQEFEERMIIEKGTPICQIIPFKRDDWKSLQEEQTEEEAMRGLFALKSKLVKSYKTQWWEKKKYI
jgi:hypothetical protein